MVGIFSRLSATKSVGLGSQEGKEERGNAKDVARFYVQHGVAPPEEFIPIEHPLEPKESDQPVHCPQPEPCIIHDGRILKERLHLGVKRRHELPFVQEREIHGLQRMSTLKRRARDKYKSTGRYSTTQETLALDLQSQPKKKVGRPRTRIEPEKNTLELNITVSIGGGDVPVNLLEHINAFLVEECLAGKCSLERGGVVWPAGE